MQVHHAIASRRRRKSFPGKGRGGLLSWEAVLLTGALSGLLAMAVTGASDRLLDPMVAPSQKRRARRVRAGSPHDVAGAFFARKVLGHRPSRREKRVSQRLFVVTYGLVWGLVYAAIRRAFPPVSRWAGLPFAVPFFFFCDGLIAPALGLTPGLQRLPWQVNAKELANHAAWTAGVEMLHRSAEAMAGSRRSSPLRRAR